MQAGNSSVGGSEMVNEADRRRTRRFIVERLAVEIDGQPHPIVDISSDHVRLSMEASGEARSCAELTFSSTMEPWCGRWRVPGEVARKEALCVVYRFQPPFENWERLLEDHNSLQVRQLIQDIGL